MKKIIVQALMLVGTVVFLAGCAKEETQTEVQYKNMDSLGGVEFELQPVVAELTDSKPETPSYAIDNLEALGSEELKERTMMRRTYVYNKPDDTSSQLGRLEWGDTIQVIGETADAQWYKISYNGRVAYVIAANVRKETEENTVIDTPVVLPTLSDNNAVEHVHEFAAATCTSPSKCSCGETKGSAKGHDYVGANCSRCGAVNPNYHVPSNSSSSNPTPTPSDPTPTPSDPTPTPSDPTPTPSDPTPTPSDPTPTPSDPTPTPSDPTPTPSDPTSSDSGGGEE